MEAGAHDGRVGFAFAASLGVDFDHLGGDLIFVKSGMNHAHCSELRVDGEIDGLGEQRDFAGRFDLAHGADRRRGVLQGKLRRGFGQPFRAFAGVRIAGIVMMRHERVDVVIAFLEIGLGDP